MKLSISMTRRETLLGLFYLLFSMLVLPSLIGIFGYWLKLSPTECNILFFFLNFMVIVSIFRRFLLESLKIALAKPWRCLVAVLGGLFFYYAGMLLVSVVIMPWVSPDFSNLNNESIFELAKEHTGLFSFATILLVPITEEMLHRGVVFQGLYRKRPLLAYVLSMVLFSVIHILDYIGFADWKTLLVCFMQYLPAGFSLAIAYTASDTIVTPIIMHIIINLTGILAMR